MKRSTKLGLTLGICFLGGLTGSAVEQRARRHDRTRFPQIGRSFDVGGRTLNIHCSGEGEPTVVFDSAGHTAGYRWINLQSPIAALTRTCWYDRAGYGWSDPAPSPPTFRTVATDLHAVLHTGAVPPPYVLVGEGLAGFHIRVYHRLYPQELAGAVLVDSAEVGPPGHEQGYQKGGMAGAPARLKKLACETLGPALLRFGFTRLFSSGRGQMPYSSTPLTADQQEELRFLSNAPVTMTGGEGCRLVESLADVQAAGNLGDLPLVVITSTHPVTQMQAEQAARNHAPGQPQLVHLSSAGRQVLVDDNQTMSITIDQAIRAVVQSVRERSAR